MNHADDYTEPADPRHVAMAIVLFVVFILFTALGSLALIAAWLS